MPSKRVKRLILAVAFAGIPLITTATCDPYYGTLGIYRDDETTGERVGLPGRNRAYFVDRYPNLILPESLDDTGWWSRPFEERELRPLRAQRFLQELVERHGDYYQMKGWGDVKKNVLRRMVRDILVKNGIKFSVKKSGFDLGDSIISVDYADMNKKLIHVFDGEEEVRRFMSSLKGTERARLEVKKSNDMIKLVPIERLEEIL